MQAPRNTLAEMLARSLPVGLELEFYHISVPPTRCIDIYSPPPGHQPLKTYSEAHSLTVTVRSSGGASVAIFAIELILYTTAKLTTLFVSKADSTGFAPLLQLPRHIGSIPRIVASTFISWLTLERHRSDRRLVLSLFARAQAQYLFPGSAENTTKHVLDDRGLVRWWCKTLDPIAREHALEDSNTLLNDESSGIKSRAYLIVPGQDKHETAAFFPPGTLNEAPNRRRWCNGHPLRQISSHSNAPPRCLVPHFPDDPKARFLDDLDEELSDVTSSQSSKFESPSKRGGGQWKSTKTLEQFWEMMAYRQECSSGRLVGFIWVVFTPIGLADSFMREAHSGPSSPLGHKAGKDLLAIRKSNKIRDKDRNRPLSGPIRPRAPRVKNTSGTARNGRQEPETTSWYHSPVCTRGNLVLDQKAYDRVHEILLRLDFAGLETAQASTAKWIKETAVIAGATRGDWAVKVVGTKMQTQETPSSQPEGNGVNVLSVKKRKRGDERAATDDSSGPNANTIGVGIQQANHARIGETIAGQDSSINVLGSGLVRKKVKSAL